MRRPLLLSFVLLLLGCVDTPYAQDPVHRVVRVALADDPTGIAGWQTWQREALRSHLARIAVGGLGWTLADLADADVEVRPYDAGMNCRFGAGRYLAGARYVQIDPACLPGDARLQYGMTHELLHWALATQTATPFLGHVCHAPGERADCHPSVFGDAVLNAVLPEDESALGEVPLGPDPLPTAVDEALFHAVGVH